MVKTLKQKERQAEGVPLKVRQIEVDHTKARHCEISEHCGQGENSIISIEGERDIRVVRK